jgi:hypothetical protein
MCSLTLAELRVEFQTGIISFAVFLHVFSYIRSSLSFRCLFSSFLLWKSQLSYIINFETAKSLKYGS